MKGIISNYRRSGHRQTPNHIIIVIDSVDKREKAEKLVGKSVSWKTPTGKEITGKVAGAHGNKGAIRAIFERGLPGQAIGTSVDIK